MLCVIICIMESSNFIDMLSSTEQIRPFCIFSSKAFVILKCYWFFLRQFIHTTRYSKLVSLKNCLENCVCKCEVLSAVCLFDADVTDSYPQERFSVGIRRRRPVFVHSSQCWSSMRLWISLSVHQNCTVGNSFSLTIVGL